MWHTLMLLTVQLRMPQALGDRVLPLDTTLPWWIADVLAPVCLLVVHSFANGAVVHVCFHSELCVTLMHLQLRQSARGPRAAVRTPRWCILLLGKHPTHPSHLQSPAAFMCQCNRIAACMLSMTAVRLWRPHLTLRERTLCPASSVGVSALTRALPPSSAARVRVCTMRRTHSSSV